MQSTIVDKIRGILFGIIIFAGMTILLNVTPAAARSLRVVDDNDTVTLKGNVNPLARPEFDVGATEPSLPMEQMILTLRLSPDKQAELDSLLSGLYDPASPSFHQWLTPEEFGELFGPAAEDMDAIILWLTSHGFVVDEIASGRTWVNFSGTVADVESAFHTQIDDFYVNGALHHANVNDPSVPQGLSDLIAGIVSLHDFPLNMMHKRTGQVLRAETSPDYTSGTSHYLAPGDFATIYNVNALYNAGIDGSGQSIAIVGRTHPSSSDWTSFRNTMGLPVNPPQVIVNGNDPGDLGFDEDTEADLDVEWSGAVAKKASIIFVVSKSTSSTDGVDLSAQYIVDNNLAPVMSTSFGACESDLGTAENSFYDNLWQQAAAQGITAFVSSGDAGAAGCNVGSDTTGSGPGVNGLASTPYNVAVGGTEFNEGSGSYWNTTNGTGYESAKSYIPETAWNESGNVSGGSGLWATGGGASSIYSKPVWQVSPGVPADGSRDLPDISLSAAGHDAYLVEIQGSFYAVSGTSASSPSFAGLMALAVQNTGQRQGNANVRLYQLGSAQYSSGGPMVFHDITSGNNSVPGVTGYSCTTGYDLATGLGSVDANALVNNWMSFTLTASPSSASVDQGSLVTTTINTAVWGGFSNAVTLSASGLPSGVTATFSPATIPSPGSGSSTLTITASASSATSVFPLTVSGAGGGITQNTIVNLTVVPVFNITTSVTNGIGGTITPATLAVVSGGNATLTITPNTGYYLTSLTDNGINVTSSVNSGSYTITDVTAAHTLIATFSVINYTINASVNGGNGSISPMSTSISYGSPVTFTITPNTGYTLTALTDNGTDVTSSVNGGSYTIADVTTAHTLIATFAVINYSINASVSGGNGSISPMSTSVGYGSPVTFTITANTGYTLSALTDNGTDVTSSVSDSSYTIADVTASHTLIATFSQVVTPVSSPAMGPWGFVAAALGLGFTLKQKNKI